MRLFRGKYSTPYVPVLIDSGADKAVFDISAATLLGIADITTGRQENNRGIGGIAPTWYHAGVCVALKDPDGNHVALELKEAGFMQMPVTGLVGRASFFEAFKITFDEAQRSLALEVNLEASNLLDWKKVPILLPPKAKAVPRRRH